MSLYVVTRVIKHKSSVLCMSHYHVTGKRGHILQRADVKVDQEWILHVRETCEEWCVCRQEVKGGTHMLQLSHQILVEGENRQRTSFSSMVSSY